MFQEYETVYISENIKGMPFFAGWALYSPITLKETILDFFLLYNGWRFQYEGPEEFKEELMRKIPKHYRVSGVITDGKLYVSDIYNINSDRYLDYFRTEYVGTDSINTDPLMPVACHEMQLERLPELYIGPYFKHISKKLLKEGKNIIIKPFIEKQYNNTRKIEILTTKGI